MDIVRLYEKRKREDIMASKTHIHAEQINKVGQIFS